MKDAAPTSRWSRLPIIGAVVRLFRRNAADADLPDDLPCPEVKTYHCGTLTYTKAGLLAVFAWLLWGDFCNTIMETVVPTVLPLKLKALQSPHWVMGLIMTTLPAILNMTVVQAVSFKSDRHRGKWGRRRPFIVWTLPFLCLSLVLLGCSENISGWLQTHMAFLRNVAPATVTIALIGFFMVVYQFFDAFVRLVFNGLLRDVVPAQFFSRFYASFRIVGNIASMLYQYFIYQYAATNMREILMGAAVLYFIGFTLLSVKVKEGEYPPIEGEDDKASRGFRAVKTFLKESYSHKWYRLFFVWNSVWALGAGVSIFAVFFNLEMGLSLADIGKLGAIGSIPTLVAMYVAAVFVDRWHPMRVTVYLGIFTAFAAFSAWVWIFVTLPAKYFFWLCMGQAFTGSFVSGLGAVCSFPLSMRTFPKSRFTQFCSSQALIRASLSTVSGIAAGLFIDRVAHLLRNSGHGPDFVYRFNFVWSGFFVIITGAFGIWAYVYWHRLGGDQTYQPPAPWSPQGIEEMEIVPTVKPQSRWLSLSLRLFDAIMWLSALGLLPMMWWMHQRGAAIALKWFALLIFPCTVATWIGWKLLECGIRRDMARSLRNEPLYNGIPHHGVLLAVSIHYLLALGIWVAQIIVTVKLAMERECIIFGIAGVITNILLTCALLVIWRMERGRSLKLETSDDEGDSPCSGDEVAPAGTP